MKLDYKTFARLLDSCNFTSVLTKNRSVKRLFKGYCIVAIVCKLHLQM